MQENKTARIHLCLHKNIKNMSKSAEKEEGRKIRTNYTHKVL